MLTHYDKIKAWKDEYFKNVVNLADVSEEICIKNPKTKEDEFFITFTRNKQRYLVNTDAWSEFPIVMKKTKRIPYRNKVYHVVSDWDSLKIMPEEYYDLMGLASQIFGMKHENYVDFELVCCIALCSYFERINVRIMSGAGFGKKCPFDIIGHLMGDVVSCNPRTAAAVEYRMMNKVLVLDELSNLAEEQRDMLSNILLVAGDNSNVYEKGSRKTDSTSDVYDISELSFVIMYNLESYYEKVGKGDKFFDRCFTPAVKDRFFPIKVEGRLDMEQFLGKQDRCTKEEKETMKKVIKTLKYFAENYSEMNTPDYLNEKDFKPKGRGLLHYDRIHTFIKRYANGIEEVYSKLMDALVHAHEQYYNRSGIEVEEIVV